MNITVINGTEKHGVTYRLKEMFLADFSDNANITEYYLPKDCPAFCAGCTNCILKGEQKCKDDDGDSPGKEIRSRKIDLGLIYPLPYRSVRKRYDLRRDPALPGKPEGSLHRGAEIRDYGGKVDIPYPLHPPHASRGRWSP